MLANHVHATFCRLLCLCWPQAGLPVTTSWISDFSLCMNTDTLSFTLRIKVNCARHLTGSWVLAVCLGLAAVLPEAWEEERTTWPTAACLSVLSTSYNACIPSCQVHRITIWLPLSVYHGPVIYAIVYYNSSIVVQFCFWPVRCGCPALIVGSL